MTWHAIARCERPPRRKLTGGILWQRLKRLEVGEAQALADKGEIMMASRFTSEHREIVVKLRNEQQLWLIAPWPGSIAMQLSKKTNPYYTKLS